MKKTEGSRSRAFILNDYKRIVENKNNQNEYSVGLVNDDIYVWEVILFGPKDTAFENGIFRAEMIFPINYPEAPPTFRFATKMWHPNIDKEGNVCISILHKPGDDMYGYEDLNERWLPVRTPESVILSVLSLLSMPNCESPANLEAAQNFRENPEEYNNKVKKVVEQSWKKDF